MPPNRLTTILEHAPPGPHLTTPQAVRDALPADLVEGVTDARLSRLIVSASAAIVEECGGRTFGRELVRDRFTGVHLSGAPLVLSRDMLDGATAEMEVAVGATTLDPAAYSVDWRAGLLFVRGVCGAIRCSYWSGWTLPTPDTDYSLPPTIEAVCIDRIALVLWSAGRDPAISRERSEGVGDVSYFKPGIHTADPRLAPYTLSTEL